MKLYTSSKQYFDTQKGIDISLPLSPYNGAIAWYVDPVKIWPVKGDGFVGKVSEGFGTNFNNIQLNPHGNGTHTENVGHISKEFHSINDSLTEFFFNAKLVTITPEVFQNPIWNETDLIINRTLLEEAIEDIGYNDALIIRTLPNTLTKKNINYSNTNPPYLTEDAMAYILETKIKHLLIDLPSVDRENDKGELKTHKMFWNYPDNPKLNKTITELIYVPDEVFDGNYILNIQIISLENDASPSKPILYKLQE